MSVFVVDASLVIEGPDAGGPSQALLQAHRWLSIVFTLTVIANFVAMSQGPPPAWVTYSPLLPLALLLFSGLYLFARERARR